MRIDEIVNQVFTRSFMGYDIEQVDVFLDEVIETLERYEAEKQEMLAAMEYLMKKLERGQKMPFADMKKAIDNERQLPKESLSEDSLQSHDEEHKTAARSIARGNGTAGKSMRAPKVSRIKGEENAKTQIIKEAKAAIPQQELTQEEADKRAKRMSAAAVNWLDELLINIAEHERLDYDKPLQGAQIVPPAPQAPEQEPTSDITAEPPEKKK
jgi:DivIVA domain-containing protein